MKTLTDKARDEKANVAEWEWVDVEYWSTEEDPEDKAAGI